MELLKGRSVKPSDKGNKKDEKEAVDIIDHFTNYLDKTEELVTEPAWMIEKFKSDV